MSHYEYSWIEESLVDRQADLLRRGESLVLLGPRNVGKRYLTRRVWDKLGGPGGGGFDRLMVSFRGGVEVGVDPHRRGGAAADMGETLAWVGGRLRDAPAGSGRVVLFAHNVDSGPSHEVRNFLKELQGFTAADPPGAGLAVVLTGEVDLSEFVRDPDPPFRADHQFVILGFGYDGFERFARQYLSALGVPDGFDVSGLIKYAYRRTGGSTSFLRFLLWEVFDRRAGDLPGPGGGASAPVPGSFWRDLGAPGADFRDVFRFELDTIGETLADYYFRYIAGLIDADRTSWTDLERLIPRAGAEAPREVKVPGDGSPHPLELVGVAERRNGLLTLPGTLVGDYIASRYTPRRFGDLFAKHALTSRDWDRAFRRYDDVSDPCERVRPYRFEDVADTDDVVKGLSTELYRAAADGPERVLERFATGCRKALGFAEVTRWRCRDREPVVEPGRVVNPGPWGPVAGGGCDAPDAAAGPAYDRLLARLGGAWGARGPLPDAEEAYCVAAVGIPAGHRDEREVLMVGRPGDATILSKARQRYVRRLVHDFLAAYARALRARRLKEEGRLRRNLKEIANDLVGRLGRDLFHPDKMIGVAAEQLCKGQKTHYGRVIFAVVDPLRRWMMPVKICYDDDPVRYPSATMDPIIYRLDPLDPKTPSGSGWVVANRKCLVTRDAARDQRVVKPVAEKLRIGAATIVPLIDARGRVVGTLHVERRDGLATTAREEHDLMAFGRRLAIALELTELGQTLVESLEAVKEPLVIFGPERGALYVTQAASERLARASGASPLEAGWYTGEDVPRLDELCLRAPGADPARLAALDGQVRRLVHEVFDGAPAAEAPVYWDAPGGPPPVSYQARATRLWDWRRGINKDLGAPNACPAVLLRLRPHRADESTALAMGELLDAATPRDVMAQALRAAERLGHPWGRLYRADEGRLVSVDGFGFASAETAERFRAGSYAIDPPGGAARWEAWACFDEGRPVLYAHRPDGPDRGADTTPAGVARRYCREPGCPEGLGKQAGEHWIDLPLQGRDRRYGKISLGAGPGLTQEAFAEVWALGRLTGGLLDSASRRESQREQVARLYDGALSRGLHGAAAEVNGWFAGVSPALTRYALARARLEASLPTDALTLSQVRGALDETAAAGRRVSEALRDVWRRARVDPSHDRRSAPADLRTLFRELEQSRPGGAAVTARLDGLPGGPQADLDAAGFFRALTAAILRASPGAGGGPAPVVLAAEGFERDGREWLRLTVTAGGDPDGLLDQPLEPGLDRPRSGGPLTTAALLREHGGTARVEPGTPARVVLELPRYAHTGPRAGGGPPVSANQAILIVDRREGLRDDLAAISRGKFPDVLVDTAGDDARAAVMLETAPRRGVGYLAVVLELVVPDQRDGDADYPFPLLRSCLAGWAWGLPDTPRMFLHAAHPAHPVVARFRLQAGADMTETADAPRQVVLPGAEPGWEERLLDELGKLIHPRRIAARLAALAPPAATGYPGAFPDPFRAGRAGNPGHASSLRDLLRDIEQHWKYLKPRLETEVRRYFDVKVLPADGVEVTSRR